MAAQRVASDPSRVLLDCGFVSKEHGGAFGLGTAGNLGKGLLCPPPPLVLVLGSGGPFGRALWRETPALEMLAHRADGHIDVKPLANEAV